jgi:hypothetical protein
LNGVKASTKARKDRAYRTPCALAYLLRYCSADLGLSFLLKKLNTMACIVASRGLGCSPEILVEDINENQAVALKWRQCAQGSLI